MQFCCLLVIFLLVFAVVSSDSSATIQTEPLLIQNNLARNFDELKLSVKFLYVGNNYLWTHPGLTRTETVIYSPFTSCVNKQEKGFKVTCQKVHDDGFTFIKSSLTLMFPLDKDVTFSVYHKFMVQLDLLSFINVKVGGKLIKLVYKLLHFKK